MQISANELFNQAQYTCQPNFHPDLKNLITVINYFSMDIQIITTETHLLYLLISCELHNKPLLLSVSLTKYMFMLKQHRGRLLRNTRTEIRKTQKSKLCSIWRMSAYEELLDVHSDGFLNYLVRKGELHLYRSWFKSWFTGL